MAGPSRNSLAHIDLFRTEVPEHSIGGQAGWGVGPAFGGAFLESRLPPISQLRKGRPASVVTCSSLCQSVAALGWDPGTSGFRAWPHPAESQPENLSICPPQVQILISSSRNSALAASGPVLKALGRPLTPTGAGWKQRSCQRWEALACWV